MLNSRSIEILNLFHQGHGFTIQELSEKFSVSSRTIRYDLDNINFVFSLYQIPRIKKNPDNKFLACISKNDLNKILDSLHYNFPDKRLAYLMLKLFSENFINLTEEAKVLDVTRETLKQHLKEIKEYIQEKNLVLKSYPGKGIFLEGSEQTIRELFSEYLLNFLRNNQWNSTPFIKQIIQNCFQEFNLELFKTTINALEKKYSFKISSLNFDEILCILLTALKRKCFFNLDDNSRFLSLEAKKIFYFTRKANILFSKKECEKIVSLLQKKNIPQISEKNIFLSDFQNKIKYPLDISQEILETLSEIDNNNIAEKILLDDLKKNAKKFLPKHTALLISQNTSFLNKKIENSLKDWNITISETLSPYLYEIYGIKDKYDFIVSTETLFSPSSQEYFFKVSPLPKEEELDSIFQFLCFK